MVLNVLVELSLLTLGVVFFNCNNAFIRLDNLEMAFHNLFIKVLLLGDMLFMAFESLFPSNILGWVIVLDDTVIHVWGHVATVVKCLSR